ncbi:uncharacterized protein VP01_1461g1 [Puccinia sorghi]|uniref:Retrotransposon gag domain-containing protein n=1 Tax=Puccinia sorghi TaxID=27349 RepID=A0A0L6VJT4_9BASI|nr:uncharacterized protein VP01_1461g1 [Puccinia sorghi]
MSVEYPLVSLRKTSRLAPPRRSTSPSCPLQRPSKRLSSAQSYFELMRMMGKEHAQQLATEETLRQTQARLDATAGQQNSASAPASNPMVIAKPQTFDGTRDTASKAFIGQIGLHAVTYPKQFPTNTSKVVFAPYMDKAFNGEPVVLNEFLNDFRSSFFDHNHRHRAKVALQPPPDRNRPLPARPQGEHTACDEQC